MITVDRQTSPINREIPGVDVWITVTMRTAKDSKVVVGSGQSYADLDSLDDDPPIYATVVDELPLSITFLSDPAIG